MTEIHHIKYSDISADGVNHENLLIVISVSKLSVECSILACLIFDILKHKFAF